MPKRSRSGRVMRPERVVAPISVKGGRSILHRARRRALADDEIELEILHRRIEDFFDRRRQAMDLVDEQNVARLEIGQERGEIAGALDDRAGGGAELDAQLARDDLRQRRLAETGRAREQHVIERLAALLGRRDEDAQIVAHLPSGRRTRRSAAAGTTARRRPRPCARPATMRGSLIAPGLLEPRAHERVERGRGTEPARRRRDRAIGVGARIAEIDERRHRFATPGPRPAPRPGRGAMPPTLSFSSLTMRWPSLGPTPSAVVSAALSCAAIAVGKALGREHAQDRERELRADALHGRQQAKPLALGLVGETIEVDVILANMGLDEKPRRLAPPRRLAERARRGKDADSRRRSRRGRCASAAT